MTGGASRQPQVARFTPDASAMSMLKDMGFAENDCIIALQICNNNLENAVTFLMNNPNPSQNMPVQVVSSSSAAAMTEQRPNTGMSESSSASNAPSQIS